MTGRDNQERQRDLRERAEALLAQESIDLSGMSSRDAEELIEELRVHQIELELQNEELRATQVQLQRLGEQYRDLYDSAPVGYVTLNRDGRIQRANVTSATMLARRQGELIKEPLSRFVAPEDQSTFHFFQTGLVRSTEVQHCEVRLVRPDGSEFVAHLEGQVKQEARLGDENAVAGGPYRVVISDVTQQRQAHEALLLAHDQLTQANRALQGEMKARERIEAELSEVRRRLAEAREMEQIHLARELHDGPVQDLYGISFQLSVLARALQEDAEQTNLQNLQKMLHQTTRRLRAACRNLRPSTLGLLGLKAAIESHTERFQEAHPEIKVRLDLQSDGQTLSEPWRLALFRIYQAAMDNVARHARAQRVWVRLEWDSEQFRLEIQDNGKGFSLPERQIQWAQEGRLGLLAAMERAHGIGGQMEIKSALGEGTTVRVVAPHIPADEV